MSTALVHLTKTRWLSHCLRNTNSKSKSGDGVANSRRPTGEENGKHAQAEFVAVATAIAQSDPDADLYLVDAQHRQARLALPSQIRILEIPF